MRYYTAKGDGGSTKLFNCPDGQRISKGDGIFEVLGGVDELNCYVGWAKAVSSRSSFPHGERDEIMSALSEIQENLFIVQAELAGADKQLTESKVAMLEGVIADFADKFPALKSFVIPGASEIGSILDVARAVSRRVERLYVREFGKKQNAALSSYLNRLSSVFYVLARYANFAHGAAEKPPEYK